MNLSKTLNEYFTEWVFHWKSTSLNQWFTEWVLNWVSTSLSEYITEWILHRATYSTLKRKSLNTPVARTLWSFFNSFTFYLYNPALTSPNSHILPLFSLAHIRRLFLIVSIDQLTISTSVNEKKMRRTIILPPNIRRFHGSLPSSKFF